MYVYIHETWKQVRHHLSSSRRNTWACGRCGCSSPSLPRSSARRSGHRSPPAPPHVGSASAAPRTCRRRPTSPTGPRRSPWALEDAQQALFFTSEASQKLLTQGVLHLTSQKVASESWCQEACRCGTARCCTSSSPRARCRRTSRRSPASATPSCHSTCLETAAKSLIRPIISIMDHRPWTIYIHTLLISYYIRYTRISYYVFLYIYLYLYIYIYSPSPTWPQSSPLADPLAHTAARGAHAPLAPVAQLRGHLRMNPYGL